jgi:hypothetical protein
MSNGTERTARASMGLLPTVFYQFRKTTKALKMSEVRDAS